MTVTQRLTKNARLVLRSGALFWLLALVLLGWVIRTIPLSAILENFARLRGYQLLTLVAINAAIVVLLSGRWWMLLRGFGHRLPYVRLSGYRLSAFSISYFTPGPHFGGEPVQVFLPKDRHGVPGTTATAAVALDKALELLANFTVLGLGTAVIVLFGLVPEANNTILVGLVLVLLALPGLYLTSAWSGRQPLTWILKRFPVPDRLVETTQITEMQVTALCQKQPRVLLVAALFSTLTWLVMLGEYWLMARFLGIDLAPAQVLAALTAARFAYLLPFPGGLGALEASQALALVTLGFTAVDGAALALLIRGRDVLLAIIGLYLLARYTGRGPFGSLKTE